VDGPAELITDRATALMVATDGPEPVVIKPLPLSSAPSTVVLTGDHVACSWCGGFTPSGPGCCESCGSPLTA